MQGCARGWQGNHPVRSLELPPQRQLPGIPRQHRAVARMHPVAVLEGQLAAARDGAEWVLWRWEDDSNRHLARGRRATHHPAVTQARIRKIAHHRGTRALDARAFFGHRKEQEAFGSDEDLCAREYTLGYGTGTAVLQYLVRVVTEGNLVFH